MQGFPGEKIGECHFHFGSKAALTAAKCDFCYTCGSGLKPDIAGRHFVPEAEVNNYPTRGSLIRNEAPP